MSKIFEPIENFKSQNKKTWLKRFLSDNRKNKIENIQHNILNQDFDPIYFENEVKEPNTFSKESGWLICSEVLISSFQKANKEAIKLINEGANYIEFDLNKQNYSSKKISKLLEKIDLSKVSIGFRNVNDEEILIEFISNLKNSKSINGTFDFLALDKTKYTKYSRALPNFKFIKIDIQKTNFEKITKAIPNYIKLKNIYFNFNLSNNIMFEICRIRSFRIWFEKKFNKSPFVSCETKLINKKINSLIQTSTQAFSAIIGGCDSLKINVKQKQLGIKQQLILKHEGLLYKITDPLHGSYYTEILTNFITSRSSMFSKTKDTQTLININKEKQNLKLTKAIKHLNFGAGQPPFLRGPYSSMYCQKKWTIRQYAGFSTAEESNEFYKKNLNAGQTGLSVAFDLPTHRGYDSDHERVKSDVGMAGVAIDTVEDIKRLFKDIPIENTSISMTMNGAVLPIMAFLISHAKEKKIPLNKITGTIQNDILKEFLVRNTYIYPPAESMRIVSDIFKYTSLNMPKFNSISVSGYHMLEAGATPELELAFTLANGLEYLKTGVKSGLNIDDFAPRISFFWGIGMDFFMEVAKMRAARILWAQIVKKFKPKNEKSLMLRAHCQTSGWSLTEQDPLNNITRTCIEGLAAVIGGTQSLHTNSYDEAITLPTPQSAKIARDTQIFLQKESNICQLIDPFGGSHFLEKLTDDLLKKATEIITDIEEKGGMTKLIELGIPKKAIEEAAVKRQAQIDSKSILIIGLNSYKSVENAQVDTLSINNSKVQKSQIKKLQKIKEKRNTKKVIKSLENITKACFENNNNLLDLCVKAATERATLGEISLACEKVFERYVPKRTISTGIYSMEIKENKIFNEAINKINLFAEKIGRRPRILVAKIGQDGHDRGANIIATSFSDLGFDVDIGPLFQTPEEITKQAIENDVHIIGISSLAGGHKTSVPKLINCLKKKSKKKILIVVGGIIPKKDHQFLYKKGVNKIFGPGTIIAQAAIEIIESI